METMSAQLFLGSFFSMAHCKENPAYKRNLRRPISTALTLTIYLWLRVSRLALSGFVEQVNLEQQDSPCYFAVTFLIPESIFAQHHCISVGIVT